MYTETGIPYYTYGLCHNDLDRPGLFQWAELLFNMCDAYVRFIDYVWVFQFQIIGANPT